MECISGVEETFMISSLRKDICKVNSDTQKKQNISCPTLYFTLHKKAIISSSPEHSTIIFLAAIWTMVPGCLAWAINHMLSWNILPSYCHRLTVKVKIATFHLFKSKFIIVINSNKYLVLIAPTSTVSSCEIWSNFRYRFMPPKFVSDFEKNKTIAQQLKQ